MTLIKSCEIHNTVYYKVCSECLHELAKAEKAQAKAEKKRNSLIAKSKAISQQPRKKISKQSAKMKDALMEYNEARKAWLPGKMCVVFPKAIATTVHHAKGRIGYADQFARDSGITLLMDQRYWVPASLDGHRYIEEHPAEAKEREWSFSRLEIIDEEKPTI